MKTLLIENQYFGTVNYYKMLFENSYIQIDQYESFQKMSFRNRCIIPGANGLIQLTVPVEKGRNQNTPIRDVKIAYKENWVIQHCRSMEACFNRAPFFEFYRDELFGLLENRPVFLFDLNWAILQWVLKKLKSPLDIGLSQLDGKAPDILMEDRKNNQLPKNYDQSALAIKYTQVFEDRIGFKPNLSIIDLLCCTGPAAISYLKATIP
ncbi:MAG: hypothetical protein EAZ12_08050 [Sphingobacteriia bacterium]|nr:MAG: hypothetical protein EAZ12_08050 [Sphingobacteriia bacterium]